jgi:alkylation response protein AidB-like acyl-CoA dehydrogenase
VDMDFTPEQELLRESVRRTCERHAGIDLVRKLENDPIGHPPALWTALAELGLLGLTLPEEHGGSGMTMLDGVIVYEEFGRALTPSPHFVSSVVAAGLLQRAGSATQQQHWLPRIAAGDSILTVGWLEPGGSFGPGGVQTRLSTSGADATVDGEKWHVPFARAAEALIVLARADDGVRAAVVDPSDPGVTLEQQLTVASDAQYAVRLSNVRAADIIGIGDVWADWHATMLDAVILCAAQAVGGGRATLELTVDYAKKREQFDRPLGAFQSIAHYLADATAAIDGAQTLVWQAAWARHEDRPVDKLAPMAKLYACRAFRNVTAMAQQVFGGNGFTLDFDVQLYFRRAKSLQLNWWDDRHLEELIATELLGAASS